MRKILSFLLALTLLASTAGAVDLYVDMNKIATDTPPAVVDGRTLVPVRAIFEAIGATVTWDDATRTATGVRGDVIVSVQIDNTTAYVNGQPRTLDVPAQIINGRTMVPARFISESMGCEVSWYQPTQTVGVADVMKDVPIYVTPTGEKYHFDNSCNGGTYYTAALAEATGRGLTPCEKCVLTSPNYVPGTTPAPVPGTDSGNSSTPGSSGIPSGNTGNGDNFNTYDNEDQQKTESQWVLNTSSKKIHYPSCSQVKKIAPQNYSTSNLSETELIAQGYSVCKVCH